MARPLRAGGGLSALDTGARGLMCDEEGEWVHGFDDGTRRPFVQITFLPMA
jgi:hypothetical protein